MKEKIIKFWAENKDVEEIRTKPLPSSSMIPDWYKNAPLFTDPKFNLNPYANVTFKKCAPILDTFTSGYIFPLWSDILVTQTESGPMLKWCVYDQVADAWNWPHSHGFEIPDGYSKTVFKYYHGWVIETPPGYSCLITSPMGYPNLPFKALNGIVDTDILKTSANSPFVVKENFEGIIKKGTPMFQLIPFKRDNWDSQYGILEDKEYHYRIEKLKTKIVNSYSSVRSKKRFK